MLPCRSFALFNVPHQVDGRPGLVPALIGDTRVVPYGNRCLFEHYRRKVLQWCAAALIPWYLHRECSRRRAPCSYIAELRANISIIRLSPWCALCECRRQVGATLQVVGGSGAPATLASMQWMRQPAGSETLEAIAGAVRCQVRRHCYALFLRHLPHNHPPAPHYQPRVFKSECCFLQGRCSAPFRFIWIQGVIMPLLVDVCTAFMLATDIMHDS